MVRLVVAVGDDDTAAAEVVPVDRAGQVRHRAPCGARPCRLGDVACARRKVEVWPALEAERRRPEQGHPTGAKQTRPGSVRLTGTVAFGPRRRQSIVHWAGDTPEGCG